MQSVRSGNGFVWKKFEWIELGDTMSNKSIRGKEFLPPRRYEELNNAIGTTVKNIALSMGETDDLTQRMFSKYLYEGHDKRFEQPLIQITFREFDPNLKGGYRTVPVNYGTDRFKENIAKTQVVEKLEKKEYYSCLLSSMHSFMDMDIAKDFLCRSFCVSPRRDEYLKALDSEVEKILARKTMAETVIRETKYEEAPLFPVNPEVVIPAQDSETVYAQGPEAVTEIMKIWERERVEALEKDKKIVTLSLRLGTAAPVGDSEFTQKDMTELLNLRKQAEDRKRWRTGDNWFLSMLDLREENAKWLRSKSEFGKTLSRFAEEHNLTKGMIRKIRHPKWEYVNQYHIDLIQKYRVDRLNLPPLPPNYDFEDYTLR
jgi:hypothetical protein